MLFLLLHTILLTSPPATQPSTQPAVALNDSRFTIGKLLFSDEFQSDTGRWSSELEKGGSVKIAGGKLDIDVPGGASVWFKSKIDGPAVIEYQACVVFAGGANDRVSDLNCFWMARDTRNPDDLFAVPRSGKFSDYDVLKCYYVGQGGNDNTTTRLRRYIGQQDSRPLLPENDRRDQAELLVANADQWIDLVACGQLIQYFRDGKKVFEMNDADAYTSGWFAVRTTRSHLEIRHFQVFQLVAAK